MFLGALKLLYFDAIAKSELFLWQILRLKPNKLFLCSRIILSTLTSYRFCIEDWISN